MDTLSWPTIFKGGRKDFYTIFETLLVQYGKIHTDGILIRKEETVKTSSAGATLNLQGKGKHNTNQLERSKIQQINEFT